MAQALQCEIISADSRQVYKEMRIGTAVPSDAELQAAVHHMIQCRSVLNPMNAYDYEHEVMALLPEVFERGHGRAILCGGSMMYVDAVCHGIDDMPTISDATRNEVKQTFENQGLEHMQEWLKTLDPEYYATVELKNQRRVLHAIEICLESGKTCTELRKGAKKERPFNIKYEKIDLPREKLYARIDRRVDEMLSRGLLDEAKNLLPLSHLTPLNTVGYKELFAHLNGAYDLTEAVRLIKRNTRHYAKKQITWLKGITPTK